MAEDFWGQFEVEQPNNTDEYWGQYEQVPQNKMALEDMNELSADDPYVAEKEYQQEQLAHMLFTPEELQAMDNQGKMGWVEYRTRFVTPKDYVPFGVVKQGADAAKLLTIANKIENGEDVTDNDKQYMYDQLRKQVEISRRGLNWGARAASMFVQAPAFCIEFAASGGLGEIAAKGAIKGAGIAATKAAIKTGTKIATSKVGAMYLGRKATEKIGTKAALNVSARIAGKGAAYQGVLVPMYAYENYQERQIADGLKVTDKGEVLFTSPDGSIKNGFKALGTGEVMILSELSGGILGGAAKGIVNKVATTNVGRGISATSAKVYNSLPKQTRVKLEAVNKILNEYGEKLKDNNIEFHGVIEEMGEERVEDILRVAFDLDDTEGYTGDQWISAIFPEAEQLLLEAGVFSIIGSTSLATRTVISDLQNKGYSQEEAQQIANNLSEIEKENMANDILGEVKMNEDITEDEVNKEAQVIQLKLNLGLEDGEQEKAIKDLDNNEAVKRGFPKEAAKKQIEKLQKGKEYRINHAGRAIFTGGYNNEGMPIFENYRGDKLEMSLTNYFEEITDDTKEEKTELLESNTSDIKSKNLSAADNQKNSNPSEEEAEETAADKIIKGESEFGKLYTDWVNRLTPIEALEKKASEKKELDVIDRPNTMARLYSGLVGSTRTQIEKNTFEITPDGNIKVTGEGFLPILNDFDNDFKNEEPKQDTRHKDLKNYLEAQRFLLDLQNRENFEATEEQKLEAVKTIADLNAKYGDRLQDFEKYADRIYKYQQRVLHNLVDSGNMSQETYDKILEDNPHYIPFQRVMDEEFSSAVSSRSKFSGAKSKVKRIKGSEKDIKDPFESILKNTYQIVDVSFRNRIAKSIANLRDVLPDYIEVRKPIYEIGNATVQVAYDAKMRAKLEAAIKYFGGKIEHKKSLGGGRGLILGSYSPMEKVVRKRLGSQDRTMAHEFGHMLDFVLGIKEKLTPEIKKEISKLAEERFKTIVTFENGEFQQEIDPISNSANYQKYVKSTREAIANMFDLYFTSRDYVKKVAPKSYKFIQDLSKGEYKFLRDIRPSSETGIEEIEQEVWIPSKMKPAGNVIEYWEDGKRKFVEVTKPVMDAVNDLTMPELNFVEKMLTASSTLLRTGATIMPDFWMRNIIRDQPIAFIQTRKTRPFIDMAKGLTSLIKKDKVYQEWLAAGGSFNSYMDLSDKSMREAVKELTSPESKLSKYLKSFGIKAIEDVSMAFEQATRIGIYAREKMNSPALISALEAREGTLDFGRSGRKGRYVNRYIPFFNAAIQGVDKMVRAFQANPVMTSIKCLSAITLPSVLLTGYYLYAAPDDDRQEYLEIPQWQKDTFWCFKLGDNWWRIPKPFEIGYVFGSLPERFMTWMYQKEMPEGKEIFETLKGLFNATSPITDVGGFMPPILRVTVENITNYNFFTGKNLYPKYLDELEPAERKNKYTSQTAQLLGQKLNVSPAKIENALSGSIGSSSKYVLDAGDSIIKEVKKYNGEEINEKPSSLNDIPVLRSFVIREPQGYQTKSVNDFFDTYKTLEQKNKTYKKKSGDEKREYFEKNGKDLKAYKRMQKYYDRMKDLNKRIQKIYDNTNLTGEEKTERIEPLAKKVSGTAFEANVWYKQYKGKD